MTHQREITKTLILAFFLNISVAAAKMVYGLWTGTLSMISDGIHSFTDGFGSLMGIISVRYASKPSDEDHHYGHTKYETLGALGIATFVGLAGWEVAKQAIHKFLHPETTTFHNIGFVIAIGTIFINFFLSRYEKKKGEELQSPILKADAIHTASDIWVSLTVIVSLVAIKFGLIWVDTTLSLGIALYFGYAAYSIVKENIMVLTDGAFLNVHTIKDLALKENGVIGCHHIRTRGTPENAYVDLHIQVPPEMTTIEAHRLAHNIENRIKNEFPGIVEVLVHTEPYPDDDEV